MILGTEEVDTVAVTIALVASVGLIVLNGFYVAYEFAVLAAKRSSFEDDPRNRPSSAAARASLSDVSMQLAGAQLGITIATLALGHISEPALEVIIEQVLGQSVSPEVARAIGITVSLSLFTVLHLIFGEMVPKNIALAAPDATLRWLVIPYRLYLFVFGPVVRLLNGMANVASRAVGIQPRDELKAVHTAAELAVIVAQATEGGAIDADDAQMLRGALDFAQRPVHEIATPLPDHPSVNLGATVGQLERAVAATGQGRILVLDPRQDSAPVGYVHVRDLLHIDPDRNSAPVPSGYVRNMAVVGAEQPLVEVLLQLRSLGQHIAVVQGADRPIGVVSQEQVVRAIIQPTDSAGSALVPGRESARNVGEIA
ncbi:MAG: CNNM domain-containing protein [Acidimicrobiales bacterium]